MPRLPRPWTIRWKLLLTILPLVAAGIGIMVWMQYCLTRRQMLAEIDKEIHGLADRTAANISDLLRQRHGDLFTLAETPLIADYYHNVDFQLHDEARMYRQELETYLLRFAKRSQVYARILYLDQAGREVCSIEANAVRKTKPAASLPDYYREAKKLRPGAWWVSPIEAMPDGRTVMHYAKSIHDEVSQFKGVLVLEYDLSQIRDILKTIRVGRRGTAFIRTGSTTFPSDAVSNLPGRHILTAESPVGGMPWRIVVEAPLEDFLDPLRRIRNAGVLTAFFGIFALIGILLWIVRSLTRPVASLMEAARQIGKGNLDHRIKRIGKDELGTLSSAFNEMADNLESNRKLNTHLQAQLIQAEKLSAIGQLISSVAHELNNPLAAVCGYAQMCLLTGCPAGLRQDLEHVNHNALRCRKVVENLLFFVRQSRQEKARIDLNRAVESAIELLEYRLVKTEDVDVTRDLSPELPDVIGDFQQIVQVLVNLINNACDAMAGAVRYPEGKRIVLRTRPEAAGLCLSIEDNGPGIPAAAQGRIFEPFFTTKESGRGTGLGLSICRQIIEEHGGSISFSTREGQGTTFTLRLPMPTGAELTVFDQPRAPVDLPAVPGRRILVVDDEKAIAELVARLLRDDGDCVEVSAQGPEALRLARDNSYDLIITDFEMEKAKGEDIYKQTMGRQQAAAPRFLFITGDILNPKVLDFLQKTKSEYLAKPFDLDDLRQAARRLLTDDRRAAQGRGSEG